jgi:hypothetical protein
MSLWAWASEHDQIFLRIFLSTSSKYLRNIFDMYDRIFADVEECSSTCSWMNNILWMNFLLKVDNKHFFCKKKWTIKSRWKFFMLVYFELINTLNVQVIFHISLIWNILSSVASKPISTPKKIWGLLAQAKNVEQFWK